MDFQFLANQIRNHPFSTNNIYLQAFFKPLETCSTQNQHNQTNSNISTNTFITKYNPIPKENKFYTQQNHMKHYQEKQSNQKNQFHIKKMHPQFWI